MTNPQVLMPPKAGRLLKLYLSATDTTIGSMLAQENDESKEHAIYYLTRILNDVERKYTLIEKLCLSLYFTCNKLRHYILLTTVHVMCKIYVNFDQIYVNSANLIYVPLKAIKGQAVVDFITENLCLHIDEEKDENLM